jgi:hypothetical protein
VPEIATGSGISGGLVAIEILHERGDAAFVDRARPLLHLLVPRVAQEQADARVQERELAIAVLELLEIIFGDLEGRGAGEEGDARALLAFRRGPRP